MPQQRVRLVLIADGPPDDRHTNSGVSMGMLAALKSHPMVAEVALIDASLRGVSKAWVALRTIGLSEVGWRVRYSQGRLAVRMRSQRVRHQVARLPGEFDVVVLIRGLYEPFEFPYASFIDATVALTQACWPPMAVKHGGQAWSPTDDQAHLRAAVHVFTAGHHVAEHVIEEYGVNRERVTAIGGGLNYPLSALPARAPSANPTVLFVGHDFERKGGDVLVEAFAQVRAARPDARLVLVGRGTPRHGNHPGVTALGDVDDRHELSELYRTATVFCLPARFEPFGLVLLEAMAHGVPCVASRVGEIPRILQDGKLGVLVDPQDVEGLAGALLSLLNDPGLQERLSHDGRVEVETNRTWAMVADRLVHTLVRELS